MRCCPFLTSGLTALLALICSPASLLAQATVDLRIVPRFGRTPVVAGYEASLDLAVQARVNSFGDSFGLSSFAFNMRIVGEPESAGLLQRAAISNFDGTYDTGISMVSSVGRGGLARQYTYLAMLNSAFNGRLNASSATFTNGPDQEIGLIAGASAGERFLSTPGIDDDGDGVPDALTPSTSVMRTYFGAGEWIDIYRFRYLISRFTGRNFSMRLEDVSGVQVFNEVRDAQGLWGPTNIPISTVSTQGFDLYTIPVPGAGVMVAFACCVLAGRRRR